MKKYLYRDLRVEPDKKIASVWQTQVIILNNDSSEEMSRMPEGLNLYLFDLKLNGKGSTA